MEKIVLASANKHKIEEFNEILGDSFKILSLDDIGFNREIDETGTTLIQNAKIKAETVRQFLKENGKDYPVIADDSGLFVHVLRGEPGVYSARYAGSHDDQANRDKLLEKLDNKLDRTANFECAICYISNETMKLFIGRTYGEITTEEIGDTSFGYDCIFYSADLRKTFGEATAKEKNAVSHRSRAAEQLRKFLTPYNRNFDRTLKFKK
jgi:XTP/dITP diphosphohydrolase